MAAGLSHISAAQLQKAEVDTVRNHQPIVEDRSALQWESLGAISSIAQQLSAEEKLRIGWAGEFNSCVRRFVEASERKPFPTDFKEAGLPRRLVEFLEAATNAAFQPSAFMKVMNERYGTNCRELFDLFREEPAYRNYVHQRTDHAHCMLFQRFQDLYLINTALTKSGAEEPTLNEAGDFE
jgi:hypothetical protein